MYSILSDDGSWVVVFDGDVDEPMEMTIQEFVDRFGEENLPTRGLQPGNSFYTEESMSELAKITHYWASFRRLCKACGSYAKLLKLDRKDANGSKDAHSGLKNIFRNDGVSIVTKLAIEIQERRVEQMACARNLNSWSQWVGYLPMRDQDLETLINHLYDADFRKRMYYRIDKHAKKFEAVSARDLVIDVLRSFKKQEKKPN